MPKNKPHKGLLKRIRLTKSGRVKFSRAFGRHLRSHKSTSLIRSYRKPQYLASVELKRLRPLLLVGPVRKRAARPSPPAEEKS
jgi:large subunit ribosomal protein L35